MKRAATGGAHRGPVAPIRQRRTLRLVQVLLVVVAGGLLFYAGYSWGRVSGYDAGTRAGAIDAPREPSRAEAVVLLVLAVGAGTAAALLQGDGAPRLPTPARLDEWAARAESAAVERAESPAVERAEHTATRDV